MARVVAGHDATHPTHPQSRFCGADAPRCTSETVRPHEKIGDVTRPESRSAYVRVATKRLFWLVANAAEGTRATKLNMAAFRLGQLGVPFDKAEGILTRAAVRCSLDTDDGTDILAVIRCGFEAGSRAA